MKNIILRTIATMLAALVAGPAMSAVQLHVSNGVLQGATGVNVNGSLYSVTFVDGSCEALFGDCTQPAAFPFSYDAAIAASQALLDQVLQDGTPGGDFLDFRARVSGCEDSAACNIFTPQTYDEQLQRVWVSAARIYDAAPDSGVIRETVCCGDPAFRPTTDLDLARDPERTWAVWKVPEPTSLALVIGAVLGGGVVRQRVRARGRQLVRIPLSS